MPHKAHLKLANQEQGGPYSGDPNSVEVSVSFLLSLKSPIFYNSPSGQWPLTLKSHTCNIVKHFNHHVIIIVIANFV